MPTVADIMRMAKAGKPKLPRALLFFKDWPDIDEFADYSTSTCSGSELRHMDFLEARVELLSKRPRGVFPERIGVGRTRNNDVALPIAGVSKYHAYFQFDEEQESYLLADAGSKNGTELLGEPLEPRSAVWIKSGDELSFGGLSCKFFHTEEFLRVVEARLRS